MIRVDAHQHFWDPAHGDYGWLTPDLVRLHRPFEPADLRPELDSAGIDATLLVQAAPSSAETGRLLNLARAHHWIAGVVGWIDLDGAGAISELADLASEPLAVGIRPMLQDLERRDWILEPHRVELLKMVAEQGLVFEALVREDQLGVIDRLAELRPELTIILDHGGKPRVVGAGPDQEWTAAIRALAARPNVACKLSGLVTEADGPVGTAELRPWFEVLVDAFGTDRLIWGSDWPVVLEASSYGAWHRASIELLDPLGPAVGRAVTGGNAIRLYGLETPR